VNRPRHKHQPILGQNATLTQRGGSEKKKKRHREGKPLRGLTVKVIAPHHLAPLHLCCNGLVRLLLL
jgi:hypothetical protein